MIEIPLYFITAVAVSFIVWFLICIFVCLIMFGDDKAFTIGPILASISILICWLCASGIIKFTW